MTSSGGAGILAADRCAEEGLGFPELGEETREKLAAHVPAFGAIGNPVDVTAQLFNDGGGAFGGRGLLVSVDGGRDGWPPVLTVGHGGTGTEIHRDVAHALAPVTAATARELLASLRCRPLLAGHRGTPPADLDAAVDVIVRIGQAALVDGLRELEVNPVVVGTSGAVAVDVLLDRAAPGEGR